MKKKSKKNEGKKEWEYTTKYPLTNSHFLSLSNLICFLHLNNLVSELAIGWKRFWISVGEIVLAEREYENDIKSSMGFTVPNIFSCIPKKMSKINIESLKFKNQIEIEVATG